MYDTRNERNVTDVQLDDESKRKCEVVTLSPTGTQLVIYYAFTCCFTFEISVVERGADTELFVLVITRIDPCSLSKAASTPPTADTRLLQCMILQCLVVGTGSDTANTFSTQPLMDCDRNITTPFRASKTHNDRQGSHLLQASAAAAPSQQCRGEAEKMTA